jgi:hypothetical protein
MNTEIQKSLNEALGILKKLHADLQNNPDDILNHLDDNIWHVETCELVTNICFASKDIAETVLTILDASKSVDSLFKGKLGE